MEHTKGKLKILFDKHTNIPIGLICENEEILRFDWTLSILRKEKLAIVKRLVLCWNSHDDLLAACQASVIAINELVKSINAIVEAANLNLFPPPPIEEIKEAIRNAGGEVYEMAEDYQAAIAKSK